MAYGLFHHHRQHACDSVAKIQRRPKLFLFFFVLLPAAIQAAAIPQQMPKSSHVLLDLSHAENSISKSLTHYAKGPIPRSAALASERSRLHMLPHDPGQSGTWSYRQMKGKANKHRERYHQQMGGSRRRKFLSAEQTFEAEEAHLNEDVNEHGHEEADEEDENEEYEDTEEEEGEEELSEEGERGSSTAATEQKIQRNEDNHKGEQNREEIKTTIRAAAGEESQEAKSAQERAEHEKAEEISATDNQEAITEENEPTTEENQPIIKEDRLTTELNRPAMEESRPTIEEKPKTDGVSKNRNVFRGVPGGAVDGTNITQVSLMVYKLVRANEIKTVVDIPCRNNLSWFPKLLERLDFEVVGFKYICVDKGADKDTQMRSLFTDAGSPEFHDIEPEQAAKLPKSDLVLSFNGPQQWGVRKTWSFFRGLRKSRPKYIIVTNNPGQKNNDKESTLNLRKQPFHVRIVQSFVRR